MTNMVVVVHSADKLAEMQTKFHIIHVCMVLHCALWRRDD